MKKLRLFMAIVLMTLIATSGDQAFGDDYCDLDQHVRNLEILFSDGTTFSEEDAYVGIDCQYWPYSLNSHTVYVPANSTLRIDDYIMGIRINTASGSSMARQTFPICYSIALPDNTCPDPGCASYTTPGPFFDQCISSPSAPVLFQV